MLLFVELQGDGKDRAACQNARSPDWQESPGCSLLDLVTAASEGFRKIDPDQRETVLVFLRTRSLCGGVTQWAWAASPSGILGSCF